MPRNRTAADRGGMGTNSRCPGRPAPFVKRAGLTCLASLAVHDKAADEAVFRADLAAVAAVAADDRQPVRKGASWVLRQIGKRSESLRQAALDTARGLLARGEPAARFAAREALRELTRPPAADKRAAARQGLA